MGSFDIDPYAKNPLYEGSMRLCDVVPGIRYVVFNAKYGVVSAIKLTSEWRIEDDVVGLLMFAPFLLANDDKGRIVNLNDDGIHPYVDGSWSEDKFAVVATDENIKKLHAWLEAEGHERAALWLEELFPGLEIGLDDSFWQRLSEHLNC